MDPKLIKALELLIKKYSNSNYQSSAICSLCREYECEECPNSFFEGCIRRYLIYPTLNFYEVKNYPTLKKFWSDYLELYKEGFDNDTIMTKLVAPLECSESC